MPWCRSSPGRTVRLNGTSHQRYKTQRALDNGMPDTHRPRAERVWGLSRLPHLDTERGTKSASDAFPPQSNPPQKRKLIFSSATTGGPLRGVPFHPLEESTHNLLKK